jgi:hypothetical protein
MVGFRAQRDEKQSKLFKRFSGRGRIIPGPASTGVSRGLWFLAGIAVILIAESAYH